jgi:hypothetical protein
MHLPAVASISARILAQTAAEWRDLYLRLRTLMRRYLRQADEEKCSR